MYYCIKPIIIFRVLLVLNDFYFSLGYVQQRKQTKRHPHILIAAGFLNMAPRVAFTLVLILIVGQLQKGPGSLAKTFTFPEYPYKETTKNVSRARIQVPHLHTELYETLI